MSTEREVNHDSDPPRSSSTSPEGDETSAGTHHELEEDVEEKTNKWAGLADRHRHYRDQSRDTSASHSTTPADSQERNTIVDGIRRTADWLDRLDDRLHSHTRTITDIETEPAVDTSSPEAVAESEENVEMVRFELDETEVTRWYSWEPQNPDHPLTHLIEYYADGDLLSLQNTEVTIAYEWDRWDYISDTGHPQILTPTPYNQQSAHLKHRLFQPLFALDNPDETALTRTTTNHESFEPAITESTRHHTRLSANCIALGGTGSVLLGWLFALLGLYITFLSPVSDTIGSAFSIGGMLFAVVIPWLLRKSIYPEPAGDNMYARAGYIVSLPLRIVAWGIQHGWTYLTQKVRALNRRDPF